MSNAMLNKVLGCEVDHSIVMKIKRQNRCKGIIVSFKLKDEQLGDIVLCGHSMCSKEDTYTQEAAYIIAVNRAAKKFLSGEYEVPHSIKKEFKKMSGRMKSYFKTGIFPKWWNEEFDGK